MLLRQFTRRRARALTPTGEAAMTIALIVAIGLAARLFFS